MACQHYDPERNHFSLDLHGVLKRDARRVIRKRIEECSRFKIASLEVVYGTPDFYDGSIASVLHEVVTDSPDVETACLPREFLDDCEQYSARVPKVTLRIRAGAANGVCDERSTFTPFPASREPDLWLRRLCESPFVPLKRTFSPEEAAQFVGRGCRAEDIGADALTPADLEQFWRTWQPAVARSCAAPAPAETPEPEREPTAEEQFDRVWSEAADAFTSGDPKRSQEKLQRCMELAGESSDARFLARTLGALSILNNAHNQSEKYRAYYDSAGATYDQSPEDTTEERVAIASILVDQMLQQGRLADAAAVWRDLRERLAAEDPEHPAELLYVLSSEAALRTQLDDLDEASRLLTDAVALLDRHPGIAAVTMANVRMQLGFLESRRGQLRKSLAHLTQAAEELELSPHSFEQSFFCRQSIASVAGQLGYNKQAEALLQSLVQVSTVPGSAADLARLATLVELGNLHMQREEWALAEPIYLRARDEVMAAGSPAKHLCDIRQNLASTYTHTGRFAEAELEFAAAFELAAQLYSPSDPWLAQLHRNRAVLLFRAGRHAEARIDNEKALKVYADCGGPPVPDVADAHMTQAMLFVVESEWEESEYHLRLALSMKNEIYGEGHPATAMPLVKLGLVLYQKRAYTQARPMLTRAIRILEDFHVNAALLSEAHLYLSLVHEATGQHKEAKKARDKSEWYKWNAKNNKEK